MLTCKIVPLHLAYQRGIFVGQFPTHRVRNGVKCRNPRLVQNSQPNTGVHFVPQVYGRDQSSKTVGCDGSVRASRCWSPAKHCGEFVEISDLSRKKGTLVHACQNWRNLE